jgi:hypothetical protein
MAQIICCRERTARRHAISHPTANRDLKVLPVDLPRRNVAKQKAGTLANMRGDFRQGLPTNYQFRNAETRCLTAETR